MFKPSVDRRRFLVLGSAFVAGVASAIPAKVLRSPVLKSGISAEGMPSVKGAAVGFWRESQPLSGLRLASWNPEVQTSSSAAANLIAAEALAESDRAFLTQGARVTLHGFHSAENVHALDVYAHFPAGDGFEAQKVAVWSYRSAPTSSAASPVSFVVPVSHDDGVTFSMVWRYRQPDGVVAASQEEAIAQFSVKAASNALKLQRGIYLFAGRDAKTGQQPDWQNYQLTLADTDRVNQKHQLVQRGVGMATVPYMLVAIDYAQPHVGELS